jgi:hypothetical protein
MPKFQVVGRTFTLLPGPGQGYAQRLGCVLAYIVMPTVVLVACSMLLRGRSQKDRWSGMLLAGGLMFGILAANQSLAKSYTDIEWLTGYWFVATAELIMFAAALMVAWTWFSTRASRADAHDSENVVLPPPPG